MPDLTSYPRSSPCSLIRRLTLIAATVIYFFPACSNATEVFVGASLNWANLDGPNINPQDSDRKIDLSLSVKSLDKYWGGSSIGYYFEFGIDTYDVERHDEWGLVTKQIIKTSTSGEYLYITPTVFYNFARNRSSDWSLKVGVGIGFGYLSLDGTIIVNRQSGPSIESVHGSDLSYSTGVIFRFEYKNLFIEAKEFKPTGKIDGLDLELQLPVFTVGYRFIL